MILSNQEVNLHACVVGLFVLETQSWSQFMVLLKSEHQFYRLWFTFARQEFPIITLLIATALHILYFVHQWHDVIINVNNFIQVVRPFTCH